MSIIIKILGCVLVFTAASAFGMNASVKYLKRQKKLKTISDGLIKMQCVIKSGGFDRIRLIGNCFDEKDITVSGGEIRINPEYLLKEDIEILEIFFKSFGLSNTENEINNIGIAVKLTEIQYDKAALAAKKNAPLFKTLGICAGLALCIFLI